MHIKIIMAMTAILGTSSSETLADVAVNFRGNLVIPECVINNNQPVQVEFGDIILQTLTSANTVYHARDFSIPMVCPYSVGTPQLTVNAAAVHNGPQGVIQTSKYNEGLVIHLRQTGGNVPIRLNEPNDVSSSVTGSGTDKTLILNAGLAQIKGMENLNSGPFTASVTMQLIYQ